MRIPKNSFFKKKYLREYTYCEYVLVGINAKSRTVHAAFSVHYFFMIIV
jgi:hypothetical protein